MSNYDVFRGRCGDWAKGLEILSDFPSEDKRYEKIQVEEETIGLVITLLSPDSGYFLPPSEVDLIVTRPDSSQVHEEENESCFANFAEKRLNLLVVNNPPAGSWRIDVASTGRVAFSVNLSLFKSRSKIPGSPGRLAPPGGPGGPLLPHCRACKITAKGLALAIVAAASLATIPHALILAVGGFLGVPGTVFASAFIGSALDDSASVIAEKLCKSVRLC